MTVGVGVSSAAVDVALEVDVEVSGSSVSVAAAELVDGRRTVVSVSGPLLEVRVVGAVVGSAVGRLLGLGVGVSGELELPGQSICTVFPSNTCPSTDVGEMSSASPQAA